MANHEQRAGLLDEENPEAVKQPAPISGPNDEDVNIDNIRMSRINANPRVRRAANNTNGQTTPKPKKSSASDLIVYIPIYLFSLAVLLHD